MSIWRKILLGIITLPLLLGAILVDILILFAFMLFIPMWILMILAVIIKGEFNINDCGDIANEFFFIVTKFYLDMVWDLEFY